ncbi:hypothetical protein Tco_0281515 [Tanacetum coccineum]
MTKFETPSDSPPITIIDFDDQPMWSSTRTVAPTPSSAIVQLPISNNFHIKADFLEISNLFQYGENQEEAVMLRTFPFSLSGEAKTCLNELNEGTITSIIRTCYGHGLTKGTIIQILYHGLDDPTQGILNAGGIFLYNTPNEAFRILEDKVLLKLDFSTSSQNNPKPKNVVSTSGSNINPDHAILVDKFEALATKIYSEFLIIRKVFKEMRDNHRDNEVKHASDYYMKDDTLICEPREANYIQGYHDRKPIDSYSYLNHNLNRKFSHSPNRTPKRYFELPKISMEEMMREWMARQTEENERMKNQVVELERKIGQGLRNRQAIFKNLERQLEFLEKKIWRAKPLPHSTYSNRITFEIYSNSPTVSPFLKDCTMHIPYTNVKTFANEVLANHVGDKELKSFDGIRTGRMTKKENNDNGATKEHPYKLKFSISYF